MMFIILCQGEEYRDLRFQVDLGRVTSSAGLLATLDLNSY